MKKTTIKKRMWVKNKDPNEKKECTPNALATCGGEGKGC